MNNSENDEVYRQKYLKYKAKYVALAKTMEGGMTIEELKTYMIRELDDKKISNIRLDRYLTYFKPNAKPVATLETSQLNTHLDGIGLISKGQRGTPIIFTSEDQNAIKNKIDKLTPLNEVHGFISNLKKYLSDKEKLKIHEENLSKLTQSVNSYLSSTQSAIQQTTQQTAQQTAQPDAQPL